MIITFKKLFSNNQTMVFVSRFLDNRLIEKYKSKSDHIKKKRRNFKTEVIYKMLKKYIKYFKYILQIHLKKI